MTTPTCPIYAGYRFPAEIISHAVWLYFRFPLSLRIVHELLAVREFPFSNEEAWRRLDESAAPFNETVVVPVKPLRGHRQLAELARGHLFIIDGGRLGGA